MASSVNKVILLGNLGKDPKVSTMTSGDKVVSFTLATSENWKDKNTGERREKTQWHNVVIFNENLGRVVEQYCRKGSKVYVEGQIETRKYNDQSGVEKYITEIVLSRFRGELTLLDPRGGGEGRDSGGGVPGHRHRLDRPRNVPAGPPDRRCSAGGDDERARLVSMGATAGIRAVDSEVA